jgi:hypothetical protein
VKNSRICHQISCGRSTEPRIYLPAFGAGELRIPGTDAECPAGVAELVDAPDSKSGFLTEVGVRFPLPAPFMMIFLYISPPIMCILRL